jgi:DNA adenine methylase
MVNLKVGSNGFHPTPLLRWAGGKQNLLKDLTSLLPPNAASRKYFEPFAGAAALFFRLAPKEAVVSDANAHLISCYQFVREQPEEVDRFLRQHAKITSKTHYYRVRETYNRSRPSARQAARFIYLNKTCFNGIFRVNNKGKFNVPYGWKEPPALPSLAELKAASKALKKAVLKAAPFEQVLADAKEGDFVYLDPPYPPLNGTAFFTHYTAERFGTSDQEKLAALFRELDARKCLVMQSNADKKQIRQLYAGFKIKRISVTRWVTCKAKRHRVRELVITNYDPAEVEKAT